MWDTIAPRDLIGHIPTSPHGGAVAGYVQGANGWPDFGLLCALFPRAYHLSIGGSHEVARCIDVESGFASITDVPWWFDHEADKSQGPPVLYGSASIVASLKAAAEGRPHLIWSAHYNYRPHVCGPATCGFPQADATQWTDRAIPGGDADQTLIASVEAFFPERKPATPPDPHRLLDFASHTHPGGLQGGPFQSPFGPLDERDTVIHYYGAHQHPDKYAAYLHELEARMTFLSLRLDTVARVLDRNKDGSASWGKDHRGERHLRLARMGKGEPPQ